MEGVIINALIFKIAPTILGIIISVRTIMSWSEKKQEENNQKLLALIDKKLDKAIYEEHRRSFEAWSNERDKQLEKEIVEIKESIEKRFDKFEVTLREINSHMLNCSKRNTG